MNCLMCVGPGTCRPSVAPAGAVQRDVVAAVGAPGAQAARCHHRAADTLLCVITRRAAAGVLMRDHPSLVVSCTCARHATPRPLGSQCSSHERRNQGQNGQQRCQQRRCGGEASGGGGGGGGRRRGERRWGWGVVGT
jgi:hypothetical protein